MKKVALFPVLIILMAGCAQSFKKGEEGLEYKIIKSGGGDQIRYGEFMQIHVGQYYDNGKSDSLVSDTRTAIPVIEVLDTVRTPPSYYSILSQLRKGDSVVIRVLSDSMFKRNPAGMPPFIKKGHFLITTIKLLNIFETKEQADSARNASMKEAQERMERESAEQLVKDDKLLQDYFKANKLQVQKAPQGTYVQIIEPGSGPLIDTSVVVKANYTGMLMDGKIFDSNTDSAFRHVTPLLVNMTDDPALGGGIIKGWKDGLTLLRKGSKAKFFIPSSLAYGAQGAAPDIKPNAILIFNIEILDVLNREQAKKAVEEEMRFFQESQLRELQQQSGQQPQ